MKIKDFFFSEALDTLEIGHVIGGATCTCGGDTCSSTNGSDYDDANGDDQDDDNTGPIIIRVRGVQQDQP